MGVDIGAVSGFVAMKDEVEWDIDYMKNNFDLNANLNGYLNEYTYSDLIEWFENDDVDDFYDVAGVLGLKYQSGFDDGYIYVDYEIIQMMFPSEKISDIPSLVNSYLISKGIKNPEVFEFDTLAYYW